MDTLGNGYYPFSIRLRNIEMSSIVCIVCASVLTVRSFMN